MLLVVDPEVVDPDVVELLVVELDPVLEVVDALVVEADVVDVVAFVGETVSSVQPIQTKATMEANTIILNPAIFIYNLLYFLRRKYGGSIAKLQVTLISLKVLLHNMFVTSNRIDEFWQLNA